LTQHGVILGTAAYMAPEQAKGKATDQRSDIWAFGCVLYALLTGRRAFDGEDVTDTLAAVLRGAPDYGLLPAETPAAVQRLLARCLERDRRKRVGALSTALFVLDEAEALMSRAAPAATDGADDRVRLAIAATRRSVIRTLVAPALVALTLVSGVLGVIAFRPRQASPVPVIRLSIPFPEGFSRSIGGRIAIAVSNDGRTLAYIVKQQLAIRLVSEFTPRIVPISGLAAGPINSPVFSPDDRELAFYSNGDGTITRVSIAGGAPLRVCSARAPTGMTWHDTGLIVGQSSGGVIRCDVDGGIPQQLLKVNTVRLPSSRNFFRAMTPCYSV
jgi:serine/threonine-protein kinase